jgi:hypothetical protein
VNAGRNAIKAVARDGSSFSTKPYSVSDITVFHQHLFAGGPVALALSTGDGEKPERYVYVVNADGSVAVGKYETAKQWIGWLPWPARRRIRHRRGQMGLGAAFRGALRHGLSGAGRAAGVSVGEVLDHDQYVDGALLINAPPADDAARARGRSTGSGSGRSNSWTA